MGEEVYKTLVNESKGRFTINFKGAFPNNKWAMPGGKIYLTKPEWDFLKVDSPHVIDEILVEEGKKPKKEKKDKKDLASFFEQNTNTAKSKIRKMESKEDVEELIRYANDNELNNKIVDALVKRSNELGE